MRTVTAPRDRNPYQDLLHSALVDEGVEAHYLSTPTPSQSLNVLLLPVSLATARMRGVRVLHLHWVSTLTFTGGGRLGAVRRISQAWFALVLHWCRVLGIRVVWTAHNVLPHEQVFWDDRAARATLLRSSSHVIVHDAQVTRALADLVGGVDRLPPVTVVPHGPFTEHYAPAGDPRDARARLGLPQDRRILLFVGRVTPEKGIDDLLDAYASLADHSAPSAQPVLVIAGRCTDERLAASLASFAARTDIDVRPDLRFLPDEVMVDHLTAADVVVLPFRDLTTSGSVLLATGQGRPVVVPDLPPLASLPEAACVRFAPGDAASLRDALAGAVAMSPTELASAGEAAHAWGTTTNWPTAGRRTAQIYRRVLEGAAS